MPQKINDKLLSWATDIDGETIAQASEGIIWGCPEDPVRLKGAPIGMYHCPSCGCMQLAGTPHLPHEEHCWLGLWYVRERDSAGVGSNQDVR